MSKRSIEQPIPLSTLLIAIAPLMPVYVILGGLCGLFMNQTGISSWQSLLNSLWVYAGASQFAMLDMLKSGATFPAIILLTFVINFRHSLMTASLAPWLLKANTPLACFSIFFITDEVWAISIREMRAGRGNLFFLFTAAVILYFIWCGATFLGWHFGQLLPKTVLFNTAVNFLSIAFFIAILGLLYEETTQLIPWLVSAVLSVFLYQFVTQTWHILIAGVSAGLLGAKMQYNKASEAENDPN